MRFLVVTQFYAPEVGAPQTRLLSFVRNLVANGHQVEVLTALPNYPRGQFLEGYEGKWTKTEFVDGVRTLRLWLYPAMGGGLKRIANFLSFSTHAFFALLGSRFSAPDCVFIESPPPTLAVATLLAARLRWPRARVITNVADLWPEIAVELGVLRRGLVYSLLRGLNTIAYRLSDGVSSATEGLTKRLIDGYGIAAKRMLFLPNGVDIEQFRPMTYDHVLAKELGVEGKRVLLYIGCFGFGHGLEKFEDLAGHLALHRPDWRMLLVGDGSEAANFRARCEKKNLSNIVFHDAIPLAELPRYYSISDAGLVPMRDVPAADYIRPSKLWQIAGCERPVVYLGHGEGARIVENERIGIVCPRVDRDTVAAIVAMVESPEGREAGVRGRTFVTQALTWSAITEQWLRQLEALQRDCSSGVLRKESA